MPSKEHSFQKKNFSIGEHFNAHLNMPVSNPKHYIPVGGCTLLILAHVYCLMNPEAKGKKK